jgi:glycogen debranching enzyme
VSAVGVEQPLETLHGGGIALSCALDGSVASDALHGLFAADTRVLSTYRITLGGIEMGMLSRTRHGHGTARWCYQNRTFHAIDGDVPAGSIFVSLRRRVDGALHDDVELTSYLDRTLRTSLVLHLDADFADIFEVKQQHLPPRVDVRRTVSDHGLVLEFRRGTFSRALHVSIGSTTRPLVVGSRLVFEVELDHAATWRCCIDAVPHVDGTPTTFCGDPHEAEDAAEAPVDVDCDELVAAPFRRGCADLHSLVIEDDSGTFVAAGMPWFSALFGRDALMTTLMTGLIGVPAVDGTLAALAGFQATTVDGWRDAEPGKLPHERRRGELAHRRLIPHTPYYGSHDAPALFCLALWHAWRWRGDRTLLDDHFDTARAALLWCDEYGDRDGDGLQEYGTRSAAGYYNQGWKDAGDAIVDVDGALGSLPLATVELQGYLYAARHAMAELFEERGDRSAAEAQRLAADRLADVVDERFWIDDEHGYALALDGTKEPLASVTSNPGHLLWSGLPGSDHAAALARRLLEPDLASGWGLRTLSARHRAYNPLSYQRGSVWPHDTALTAAGLARYGHHGPAAELLRGVLEAARACEDDRLPELFCGFARSDGPPVPYAGANVPQAWAAAVPILAVQTFLGLVPDAPRHRCVLAPWLPDWLPRLEVRGIAVGDAVVDIALRRGGDETVAETNATAGFDVVVGEVRAPLWGRPMRSPR